MIQVLEKDNVFLSGFEQLKKHTGAQGLPWLDRFRRAAMARFRERGFPTTRDEEWRFTDVSPLVKIPFAPAYPSTGVLTPRQLEQAALPGADGARIVLVDGRYSHALSSTEALPRGVVLGSLAEVLRTCPQLVEPHLGRHAAYAEHSFVGLNMAFFHDGAFVHLGPGTVVKGPIHVLHLWTAADRARVAHPRNLIVAQRHSDAKIVESYLGPAGHVYFTNAVTEIVLGESAAVDHYKLQREGDEAFHMGTVEVHQGSASTFSSHLISLGGSLVRNETNTYLGGEGCQCTLGGLYIARGRQHMDTRTRIDHAKPHGRSQELYKGILDDRAHGVFNGKIFVHQNARKTDAKQTNQALLLSDSATINTKPQLEIFADDVRCTHGATVGQLDREALFYLRSRGISHQQARNLLVYAFAHDVIGRIRLGAIRAELEQVLLATRGLPIDTAIEETT